MGTTFKEKSESELFTDPKSKFLSDPILEELVALGRKMKVKKVVPFVRTAKKNPQKLGDVPISWRQSDTILLKLPPMYNAHWTSAKQLASLLRRAGIGILTDVILAGSEWQNYVSVYNNSSLYIIY